MNTIIDRFRYVQIVMLSATILLIAVAASLQIFDDRAKEISRNTTLGKLNIYPSRGTIYDRKGNLLVANEPMYDLEVIYKELDKNMDTLQLCNLLNINQSEFESKIEKNWRTKYYSKNAPFIFLKQIHPRNFSRFQEHLYEFPGFYPVLKNVRRYPHANAAHVLGYLNEVDQKAIDTSKSVYSPGDFHGISGIEKAYESDLRGSKGTQFILKNNVGKPVGSFANGDMDSSALAGQDIYATLDLELQQYAEALLQNKKGSIVAIEPSTGEILCMVSSPNFDPNLLSIDRQRGKGFADLVEDTLKTQPFLDRSVMGSYPPGSIFKPILSLIAMQEGILKPNRTIYCDGEYEINSKGHAQGCRDHPITYDVMTALQYSCNSYFYQIMREIIEINGYTNPEFGLDLVMNHLKDFGLGDKLSDELAHEHIGFLPFSEYYDKKYNTRTSKWRSTYILSLGIGQGELEFTTLQMANLAAIIANRGYYFKPHLLKSFRNESYPYPASLREKKAVNIDEKYFDPVVEGMHRVVRAGSGYSAYVRGLDICGKTGTSQNSHGEDHSVFIAFAPKENPKIAIAVFVENAGSGSSFAAPISGLLIEQYLNGEVQEWRKNNTEARIKSINLINPI